MEAVLRMELPPKVFLINRFHGERLGELLLLKMKAGETRRKELPPKVFLILRMRNHLLLVISLCLAENSNTCINCCWIRRRRGKFASETRCIRRVQPLDIDFRTQFGSWIMDKILEDLPNLRNFKLKQFYNGGDPTVHQDVAAKVFMWFEIRNWPKLSQLEVFET